MLMMKKNKQASTPLRARPRVLIAMGEREINATSMRLLRYPLTLAGLGYHVDVMTLLLQQEERFWTMRERDTFAQTFVKLYQDVPLPGADMPFWKTVAFDDFLWHVSRTIQAPIEGDYQAVFMPVPSALERPREATDVFYTNIVYYCKQRRVPLVGMQVYPITDVPAIYVNVPDYWLVNARREADYNVDKGIDPSRVCVVDGSKDGYCISTVDDPFLSMLMKDELQVTKDVLAVAIVNHASNRIQIRKNNKTQKHNRHKKIVFFVFVGIVVRELTEKALFDDLVLPVLTKNVEEYYAVDNGGVMRTLKLSDVIVSTSYVLPLSFAGRYGKTSIVYNPLQETSPYVEGVSFVNDPGALAKVFQEAWELKQAQMHLVDVMKRVMP